MNTTAPAAAPYPVDIDVAPATQDRNQLTTAFRIILALPHVLLVGGPIGATLSWSWTSDDGGNSLGGGGGVIGLAAFVCAIISWFAIVFTGNQPRGLWNFIVFYMRWRVRAVAYIALLRDEYPPFGEAEYPAGLQVRYPDETRNRITVAFRILLAIPHLIAVWVLGIAWLIATVVAWFTIVFTGRYPEGLYDFGVGVFRWSTRVEAYMLLLRDEYPPFTLD